MPLSMTARQLDSATHSATRTRHLCMSTAPCPNLSPLPAECGSAHTLQSSHNDPEYGERKALTLSMTVARTDTATPNLVCACHKRASHWPETQPHFTQSARRTQHFKQFITRLSSAATMKSTGFATQSRNPSSHADAVAGLWATARALKQQDVSSARDHTSTQIETGNGTPVVTNVCSHKVEPAQDTTAPDTSSMIDVRKVCLFKHLRRAPTNSDATHDSDGNCHVTRTPWQRRYHTNDPAHRGPAQHTTYCM